MKTLVEMKPRLFALIVTALLAGFPFLARWYGLEAWIQYH